MDPITATIVPILGGLALAAASSAGGLLAGAVRGFLGSGKEQQDFAKNVAALQYEKIVTPVEGFSDKELTFDQARAVILFGIYDLMLQERYRVTVKDGKGERTIPLVCVKNGGQTLLKYADAVLTKMHKDLLNGATTINVNTAFSTSYHEHGEEEGADGTSGKDGRKGKKKALRSSEPVIFAGDISSDEDFKHDDDDDDSTSSSSSSSENDDDDDDNDDFFERRLSKLDKT